MKILAKKSLGQNFLTDINIINKIINIGNIKNCDHILEVGPGTGNLTREIIGRKPSRVFLVEKDKSLCTKLKNEFDNKINIINEDILKIKENNLLTDSDISNIENEVKVIIEDCLKFAEDSPLPDMSVARDKIYYSDS